MNHSVIVAMQDAEPHKTRVKENMEESLGIKPPTETQENDVTDDVHLKSGCRGIVRIAQRRVSSHVFK